MKQVPMQASQHTPTGNAIQAPSPEMGMANPVDNRWTRTIRNRKLGLSGTESGLKSAEMLGSRVP